MKLLLSTFFACQLSLSAATVWKIGDPGISSITFTKDPFTNSADQANWDSISPSVAITRLGVNNAGQIYNPLVESFWTVPAPSGTLWAFGGINGNPAILSADNFAALTFAPFRQAYGQTNAPGIVGRTAVLHLLAEDVYLDISFNSWGVGRANDGGSFSYTRAQGTIPEPSTLALFLSFGSLTLLRRRR